ncbi:hypothetical protein [Spiroplasma endosymbiont of Clivina fossor]|uniref:hypothetical protein n=1 Tax=Spiroplasma endosymbiont of Clivina fossor TaxID=3066282 RepID=UPI00313CE620
MKKIFPTYKQAFFSMFKIKVQMILLILLTIILTARISLAMSTINNLKQSNNFMGQEVKYDYYYKFNFSNTDFTESNKLTVSDFSISNNPNDDSLIKLETKNVQLITKKVNEQYTIDDIKLVNYLKWEQINHQSSYFQKSIIGKILKEKYHHAINNIEFKQLFNKFINVIDIYFSSLLNKMLWNYYINIYKNNPNFFQYPSDNNRLLAKLI